MNESCERDGWFAGFPRPTGERGFAYMQQMERERALHKYICPSIPSQCLHRGHKNSNNNDNNSNTPRSFGLRIEGPPIPLNDECDASTAHREFELAGRIVGCCVHETQDSDCQLGNVHYLSDRGPGTRDNNACGILDGIY